MCPKKHEHISVAVSKVVCAKATHYTGITGDYINKHFKKKNLWQYNRLGPGPWLFSRPANPIVDVSRAQVVKLDVKSFLLSLCV